MNLGMDFFVLGIGVKMSEVFSLSLYLSLKSILRSIFF